MLKESFAIIVKISKKKRGKMAKKTVLFEVITEFLDEEFEDLMDALNCTVEGFVGSQTLADEINDRLDTVVELRKQQLIKNLERKFGTVVVYEKSNTNFHEARIMTERILESLIKIGIISDEYPFLVDIPITKVNETTNVILENI
jgi:hypothetical protein